MRARDHFRIIWTPGQIWNMLGVVFEHMLYGEVPGVVDNNSPTLATSSE